MEISVYFLLLQVVLLSFKVQNYINQSVKERYIDEYFHLGQTESYLIYHNYSYWNPKITTPPGLYILGTLLGHIINVIRPRYLSLDSHSNLVSLRYLNR